MIDPNSFICAACVFVVTLVTHASGRYFRAFLSCGGHHLRIQMECHLWPVPSSKKPTKLPPSHINADQLQTERFSIASITPQWRDLIWKLTPVAAIKPLNWWAGLGGKGPRNCLKLFYTSQTRFSLYFERSLASPIYIHHEFFKHSKAEPEANSKLMKNSEEPHLSRIAVTRRPNHALHPHPNPRKPLQQKKVCKREGTFIQPSCTTINRRNDRRKLKLKTTTRQQVGWGDERPREGATEIEQSRQTSLLTSSRSAELCRWPISASLVSTLSLQLLAFLFWPLVSHDPRSTTIGSLPEFMIAADIHGPQSMQSPHRSWSTLCDQQATQLHAMFASKAYDVTTIAQAQSPYSPHTSTQTKVKALVLSSMSGELDGVVKLASTDLHRTRLNLVSSWSRISTKTARERHVAPWRPGASSSSHSFLVCWSEHLCRAVEAEIRFTCVCSGPTNAWKKRARPHWEKKRVIVEENSCDP